MKTLLVAVMLAMLTGCVGYVHDRYPHDNRDGGFCPPGQAKKGNC